MNGLKTLLLNSTHECLRFVSERKVIKYLVKDKVEVLSTWNENLIWSNGSMPLPSIVRMKYYVRAPRKKVRFNKREVFKRDNYQCQYCGSTTRSTLTIDHVVPKAMSGESSWENCVTSCKTCNNTKGDRTPAQAKMPLLKKPSSPYMIYGLINEYENISKKHSKWKMFLGIT